MSGPWEDYAPGTPPAPGPIIVRPRSEVMAQIANISAPKESTDSAPWMDYQQTPPKPPAATNAERRDVLGFLSNIPKSTGSLIGGVLNVPQQVEGITNLFASMAAKTGMKPLPGADTNAVDSLVQHYKDRYGSWDGFKKAVYEDPAGVAFDAAMVLEPMAGGLELAGLPRAAAMTERVARTINPVAQAVRAGAAVAPYVGTAAEATGAIAKGAAADAFAPGKLGKRYLNFPVPRFVETGTAGSGAGAAIAGPTGAKIGAVVGGAAPFIRGGVQGLRDFLAEREAQAAFEARAQRQLPPGATAMPPPADTSFVRGVPAEYAQPEPLPPERQLPAPTAPIVTPAPADTSYVRAVPAEYPEVVPPYERGTGTAAPPTPEALALRQAMVDLGQRRAAAAAPAAEAPSPAQAPAPVAPAAQALESSMRVDTLTDYLRRNRIPGDMIDQFGPKEWQLVADGAGVQPPDAAQAASIRQNIADFEGAATMEGAGKKAPAEAKAEFARRKAIRTAAQPAPEAPPPEPPVAPAAPAAGGLTLPEGHMAVPEGSAVLEPLPEGVPEHYRDIQQREGTSNALRAYQKDKRVARYVLSKGITADDFAALPLDQQNKLVVEAPTLSGKGKHRPFVQPAEGQPRTMGRWADEGIRHITETMRTMEPATVEKAGAEANFQQQKAAFQSTRLQKARISQ